VPPHVHGPSCDHSGDRPIGWWLKHVDGLVESSMDRVLANEGIGRRHWQALNAVAGGADTEAAVAAAVGGETRLVLDQLRAQHWTQEIAGRITVTATGSAARGRLVAAIRDYRARITDGVSEEQYRTTLETLQRMARNLS
jgi:hypothetical protein